MRSADFENLLDRARRLWTVRIIAECAGIGLLAGCVGAMLLVPILLWRRQPGQTVAAMLPTVGAVLGSVTGLRRRPNLGEVAQLADVRLETADLLATALALRKSSDPWDATILTMANACSVGLSPTLIVPHRLGRRAWSGILLAVVAVITLGLFSITAPKNAAQAAAASTASDDWKRWEAAGSQSPPSAQFGIPSAREARAETTPDSDTSQDASESPSADQPGVSSAHSIGDGGSAAATGGGSARTDASNHLMTPPRNESAAGNSANDGAIAAAGQGREVRPGFGSEMTVGQVESPDSQRIAPWSSTGWPAAQTAAYNAIESRRVPDTYREMVRDYFRASSENDEQFNRK